LGEIASNQLPEDDRVNLTRSFDMRRLGVLFDLKHNRVAGPDGLPAEFYQVFWVFIKIDLKDMFDLSSGKNRH
jgi:hypothetical protein